jgi:hypothetical protein
MKPKRKPVNAPIVDFWLFLVVFLKYPSNLVNVLGGLLFSSSVFFIVEVLTLLSNFSVFFRFSK